MADIVVGDILVVDGNEYPIKAVGRWSGTAVTPSILHMTSLACSTKRAQWTGSKRGLPTSYLSNLTCMPLDPVDPELASSMHLEAPEQALQTVVADTGGYLQIFVEDVQR